MKARTEEIYDGLLKMVKTGLVIMARDHRRTHEDMDEPCPTCGWIHSAKAAIARAEGRE